jgi:deoxyribonuclease-4
MTISFIGAHIAKQKTLLDTIKIIKDNGGNALQLFASNPRSVALPNIEKYTKEVPSVLKYCEENAMKLIIHSPYTINLAKDMKNGDRTLDIKDCYWINLLIEELKISDLINSSGVVVHVGKYTTQTYEDGLQNMKDYIKYIVAYLKKNNIKSKFILETPAGQGTELLTDLNEFVKFYNSFSVDEKKHMGICLDTCHVYSAGYELSDAYNIIYAKNAKDVVVIHLNSSMKGLNAKVDKHAPILDGKIPVKDIENFLKLIKTNKHIPLIILEKPSNNLNKDINFIKNII